MGSFPFPATRHANPISGLTYQLAHYNRDDEKDDQCDQVLGRINLEGMEGLDKKVVKKLEKQAGCP